MNFGHVEIAELGKINLTLPPDPAMNSMVLPGKPADQFRFNLGLSSWGKPEWVGKLYPNKTKEKDFLSIYGQHFNAIELNATHYKLYGEMGTQHWKERVNNPGFKFCPKMYKGVTHAGALIGKETIIEEFLKGVSGFGDQLGPILLQLSEKFTLHRRNELDHFLERLPRHPSIFVELREPAWFSNASVFERLRNENLGAVITDAAGRRDAVHMHLTIPKVFVRFVANDMHSTDKIRIADWAHRIHSWRRNGLEEVNFFVHSQDDYEVLQVAKMAIETFNQICDAGLKPIRLISDNTLF